MSMCGCVGPGVNSPVHIQRAMCGNVGRAMKNKLIREESELHVCVWGSRGNLKTAGAQIGGVCPGQWEGPTGHTGHAMGSVKAGNMIPFNGQHSNGGQCGAGASCVGIQRGLLIGQLQTRNGVHVLSESKVGAGASVWEGQFVW